MHDRGDPVDGILVAAELQRQGALEAVGGESRIAELLAHTPAAGTVPHHARLIRDAHLNRQAIRLAHDVIVAARGPGIQNAPDTLRALTTLDHTTGGAAMATLDLTELLAGPIPETAWIWEGWLAQQDLALLVGDPGVGKSLLALGLANAARTGSPFLGANTTRTRVGIIDLENPIGEVHKRLRRIGLTADNHAGLAYIHFPALDLHNPDGVNRLTATIDQEALGLVILDSFRRIAPTVDENDSGAVASFFEPLRRLTVTRNVTIIVIHHAKKRTGLSSIDDDAAQVTRGSGDFLGAIDTQITVRRGKEPRTFTLRHGKSRRGLEHEAVLVSVSAADDDNLTFTNEGNTYAAEDKVERMLERIIQALDDDGGVLDRTTLSLRVDVSRDDGSFKRALALGYDRDLLAKSQEGKKTYYSTAPKTLDELPL